MNEPVENLYFNWLCAKVNRVIRPTSPLTLMRALHNTEFVWLLVGDDNRAEDGKELRREFILMADIPDDVHWRTQVPCSVFEMLIAFSRRAENNSRTAARDWFWIFLDNLNLKELDNDLDADPEEIIQVLEHFMFREFRANGDGGLFPLQRPSRDQREIEVWHQFCDYLVDRQLL